MRLAVQASDPWKNVAIHHPPLLSSLFYLLNQWFSKWALPPILRSHLETLGRSEGQGALEQTERKKSFQERLECGMGGKGAASRKAWELLQ